MRKVEDIWCESVGRDYKFNLKPVDELEEGWQGLMQPFYFNLAKSITL